MSKNGPAFPSPGVVMHESTDSGPREYQQGAYEGMSLRDYFAAAALPAVIAAYVEANGRCIGTEHVLDNCSVHAFRFADAMLLAQRSKT